MRSARLFAAVSAALASTRAWADIPSGSFPNSTNQGPSTSRTPYVVPIASGVRTVSVFSVGTQDTSGVVALDTVNTKPGGGDYVMVGSPDGLGLFDNGDGTFSLLMNHELGGTAGVSRTHGSTGSFVSKWIISGSTLQVTNGSDLIQTVATWNTGTSAYNSPATGVTLNRFCSGDLPALSAFYNSATGKGYNGRIFMNGEENGAEARALAHVATNAPGFSSAGTTYQLPRLGRANWENSVANPFAQDKTIVAVNDDTAGGQVYFYIGTKNNTGTIAVDRAGLTNGSLYSLKINGITSENTTDGLNGTTSRRFTMHNFGDVTSTTGATLESSSTSNSVMAFSRPEDGAWDPVHPTDYYFATTGSGMPTRLWRARFDDITNPTALGGDGFSGSVEMLYQGTTTTASTTDAVMLDNITIDGFGHILAQEDPGSSTRSSRVWMYDILTDQMTIIARHDPNRFGQNGSDGTSIAATSPFTSSEESSGIVDASSMLGAGWFLLDVQAHYSGAGTGITTEMVEGGQLLALYNPASAAGTRWSVNADGNWTAGGNWWGGVPNAAGAVANFEAIITAPRTVTVNSPQTVGTINFNSAIAYTIGGASTLTIQGSAINVLAGSHTISAPLSLNSSTTINVTNGASTLTISNQMSAAAVTITKTGAGTLAVKNIRAAGLTMSNGTVAAAADGSANGTSVVSALSISAAKLDLNNNDLIVRSGTLGTLTNTTYSGISGLIQSGRKTDGSWTGTGITSSAAAADSVNGTYALGIATAGDISVTTFSGQTVSTSDVLVKYTYAGDANLSGTVNFDDFNKFLAGYTHIESASWFTGDFNYSGGVDFDDFNKFLTGFAYFNAHPSEVLSPAEQLFSAAVVPDDASPAPEPAAGVFVTNAALLMLRRRRRAI